MSSNTEIMRQGVMSTGDDARIFPDVEACIDCGGCVVACKRTWDSSADEQRISISTMMEGQEGAEGLNAHSARALSQGEMPGETSVPMQCYHCENAPCVSVCPTDSLVKQEDGFVQVPDGPGLGVEVDEDALDSASREPDWHNPVWRRADGSVAEW